MRVLQVIHGYPPQYCAGSEIYTQSVSQALVRAGHEVAVFAREEDPFLPDYDVRVDQDPEEPGIAVHLVNMPRSRDRYRDPEVDGRFEELLGSFEPDVVHVGHLSHLSTSIVEAAHRRGVPVIFTLHDFWLMCPRGQFLQYSLGDPEPWRLCDGQDDRKCAVHCYSRYYSGFPDDEPEDVLYWTDWVHRRMGHVRALAGLVDVFIAPSRTVYAKFRDEFGIPRERLALLDYGFDRARLSGRWRDPESEFVFGYIGSHKPAKGIQVLLDAFAQVRGPVRLRIWGRPDARTTSALQDRADRALPRHRNRVDWLGEYPPRDIVREVFNRVDAIVVPSIWLENSPLVIHEAQQARVPVIASNLGGMAEYVRHEVNGFLFEPRNAADLARQMQRLLDAPELGRSLGRRGYLASPSGDVPRIEDHVETLLSLYERALQPRRLVP